MGNELVNIEKLDALVVFSKGGAKSLVDRVRDEVMDEVYDLTTVKGRKRIASRAFDVSKSKTALDNFGKDLADQLNAKLKPINLERKYARDELDKLRDEVRQPLTDWEDEQARIKEAAEAVKAAEELAIQVANDQEMALLLDDKFNADAKGELERIEQERIAYEAELKASAAAEATRQAEQQAEAQRKQVEEDKQAAIRNEQRAILEKEQSEEREKQAVINAENAENQRVIDLENAEKAKVIQAERAEARRIADIETAKQNQILVQQAEQNRLAVEQQARDDDKEHRRAANNNIIQSLSKAGIGEDEAKRAIQMILKSQVPYVTITY